LEKTVRSILIVTTLVVLLALLGSTNVLADESFKIYLNDDLYTQEFAPNILTWSQPNLYLGYDLLYGKGRTRVYQYLPLEYLESRGISGNDIKSANLFLWQYYNQSGSDYLIDWGKNFYWLESV
jgi:hypothetical protein